MIPIQSTYIINKRTNALIPARAIDHDTIVIKEDQIVHIRQTPKQIIKKSCFRNWFTYEGRREAVIKHTNFCQKVPLPICIRNRIYLFPTHSPKHMNNCWIAYPRIRSVHAVQNTCKVKPQTTIHFKDGQSLTVNVSKYTIQTQMNRTSQIMDQAETMKYLLKT